MRKIILVSSFIAILTSCASAPNHFIINTAPVISHNAPIIKNIGITVADPRAKQAILRLTEDGKHSYISSNISTTELVKQGLSDNFRQQLAIGISPNGEPTLSVTIDKMALKLEQGIVSYETQSLIIFKVAINNGAKTLNKTFKRQGTSKGPLKADIAVLESEFSTLLTQLYNDIGEDPQVRSYLTL